MANTKYDSVMAILEDEYSKELECAMRTKEIMKKTLNPFKRIKQKRMYATFMNHSTGIHIAMHRIKRELES